jgi:hypothetical protein
MFLVGVFLFYIFIIANNIVDDSIKPYKEIINKKVLIEKDTLTVIDYSAIKNEIILSNGKTVALKYAQLNTIK